MRIRTLIADDEPLAREGLALRLASFPQISVVAECVNTPHLMETLRRESIDLAFIDIDMPGGSSLNALKHDYPTATELVFVTAYKQFALDAYACKPLDYLLKPVKQERLANVVDEVLRRKRQNAAIDPMVSIQETERIWHQLLVRNIRYVRAAKDYVYVVMNDQEIMMRKTMKSMFNVLSEFDFMQIHRSTLVNQAHISAIKPTPGNELIIHLHSGEALEVGKTYRSMINTYMKV